MSGRRVVVLGGAGVFGRLIAGRLARDKTVDLVLAGRSRTALEAAAIGIRASVPAAQVSVQTLDIAAAGLADGLRDLGTAVTVDATGPFQGRDYRVPEACIAAGCSYVDLADGRDFVAGIGALDERARAAGIAIIAGASSVPGLSSAVADRLAAGLAVETIRIAILPGQRQQRGPAVMRAVLAQAGRPVRVWEEGRWRRRHGWQDSRAVEVAGIGRRRAAVCDVPDLDLFPVRYPGIRTVTFHAGLEVAALQAGMAGLAWLVRAGLLRSGAALAGAGRRLAPLLDPAGGDRGAMMIDVTGRDTAGRRIARRWTLLAGSGHGPSIPALPAVLIARRLLDGEIGPGSRPCLGLFTPEEFLAEAADLDIAATATEGAG